INAAAADPRIKATLASTMYDMSRVSANAYFDSADTPQDRDKLRAQLAAQRSEDFRNGSPALAGGVPDILPDDAPDFLRDYYDYYKTPRGYHPRSLNSNGGRTATSPIPWINFPLMTRAGEIRNAVMIVHGEKAHSFYFGSDAYKKLSVIPGQENNKLFMVVPGASHTDLYDRKDIIPFDAIERFFKNTFERSASN
ncbi:MAG: alpha/beta hydrolase, partial [Muribaculaceae bacterium]|nr:alpha/beta hydrolase [Muribaculaceae bacterium]